MSAEDSLPDSGNDGKAENGFDDRPAGVKPLPEQPHATTRTSTRIPGVAKHEA